MISDGNMLLELLDVFMCLGVGELILISLFTLKSYLSSCSLSLRHGACPKTPL